MSVFFFIMVPSFTMLQAITKKFIISRKNNCGNIIIHTRYFPGSECGYGCSPNIRPEPNLMNNTRVSYSTQTQFSCTHPGMINQIGFGLSMIPWFSNQVWFEVSLRPGCYSSSWFRVGFWITPISTTRTREYRVRTYEYNACLLL